MQMSASFVDSSPVTEFAARLRSRAVEHPCASHPLFDCLKKAELSNRQLAGLLRNYDAHASVLRRLLLKIATMMPEPAVPYVLENVRNEYGNGNYAENHQDQLRDLVWACGISKAEFFGVLVQDGVRRFIKEASTVYNARFLPPGLRVPAVAAGAVTATELLAVQEFACMQQAFTARGLQHHRWFHHVSIEQEHSDESLALALYFSVDKVGCESVEFGLERILDANIALYDGFLAAMA